MSILIPITLFGWPLVSIAFFAIFPPLRAMILSMLGAWLFLPMASYSLPGIPDYTKMLASSLGVLLGTALFDPTRFFRFQPILWDLPMLVLIVCPFLSSIFNGLGAYDGMSAVVTQISIWGLPYVIGRIYLHDLASVHELIWALFLGGLVYVPFCLFEIRMSPQLHTWVYGYHQHSFGQTMRLGGWRPTVFMQHGLMVGMWMCMTALIGVGIWMSKKDGYRFGGYPIGWWVATLLVTALLCKSTGAIVLFGLGTFVLIGIRRFPSRLWLIGLASIAPGYTMARIGGWSGQSIIDVAKYFNEDRADSLEFRMVNENRLISKALERPIFGWGGWGRNRVYDEEGRDITITDGLWIIVLGINGMVGLIPISMVFIGPILRWACMNSPKSLAAKEFIPVTTLAIVLALYWIDCLPNAVVNPIFAVCAAALITVRI